MVIRPAETSGKSARVGKLGQGLGGGFEMELGRGAEGVGSVLVDQVAGGLKDGGGSAFGKLGAPFFFGGGEPVDELFAGKDRGGGDGVVAFGFGLLAEFDLASLFHEGALEDARVGELVAEGGGATGLAFAEIFDDAGMAPGEEAVEVADFFVERVVFIGGNDDDLADEAGGVADNFGEFADLGVGADGLAVADAGVAKMAGAVFIRVGAGDDEGSEKVTLAAFVDAEVRGEAFGVVEFLVAEAGFAENFGFEGKLDELFGFLALDDGFGAFFVNGDGEAGLLGEADGVGARREFEALLEEKAVQLFRLIGGQGHGVGAERRHRMNRRM